MSRGQGGTRGWRSGADSPWSLHGNESCPHQSQPGEPCAGLLPQGRSASPVFSMLLTLGPLVPPNPATTPQLATASRVVPDHTSL